MVAIGTMIHILHMDKVILDEYDFVLFVVLFGTFGVDALNVVDTRQSWVVLEVLVDVLFVIRFITRKVVFRDAHAIRFGVLNDVVAILTMILKMIVVIQLDIRKVMTQVAKLHLYHFLQKNIYMLVALNF